MTDLNKLDKKLILLGDEDGVSAPVMASCFETLHAEAVHAVTECFG